MVRSFVWPLVVGAALAAIAVSASGLPVPERARSGASVPPLCTPPADPPFYFWNGLVDGGDWWTPLDVNADTSFMSRLPESGDSTSAEQWVRMQMDWASDGAIQLFGNPAYLAAFDDKIRAWNPNASNYSGTIGSCGWPLDPAGQAGYFRSSDCFWEDFRHGWNDSSVTIALVQSCCIKDAIRLPNLTWYPANPAGARPPLPFAGFVNVTQDAVEYPPGVVRTKNVLDLIALNEDNDEPAVCGNCARNTPCPSCHKRVAAAGAIQTAQLFASGRYDVLAKVPAASGLVWSIATSHGEEHLAAPSCTDYSCYRDGYRGVDPDLPPASKVPWSACCGGIEGCCRTGSDRPASCPPASKCDCCDLLDKEGACPSPTVCNKYYDGAPAACALNHTQPDPQAAGNTSFAAWNTLVSHRAAMEIPANCDSTSVCGNPPEPSWNFTQRLNNHAACIARLNTLNMQTYIQTNEGGGGPASSRMCGAAFQTTATSNRTTTPFQLIGDGQYHKYTIDWHTGGVDCNGKPEPGRVDFFVDDVYMGTNNVFVPTRASRLVISNFAATEDSGWNNWPDNWGGGKPNDGELYLQHTYISEIKITPYNEPNDIVYPMSFDQPDGCQPFYAAAGGCHAHWVGTGARPGPLQHPQSGVLGGTCTAAS